MTDTDIVVFHVWYKSFAGGARTANRIADALDADLKTLYVDRAVRDRTDAEALRQRKYTTFPTNRLLGLPGVEFLSVAIDVERLDFREYDVVLTSGNFGHLYLPADGQRHLHYFDGVRGVYDPSVYHDLTSGRLGWLKTLYAQWLRGLTQDHAAHVDTWLCNSDNTARRCLRYYGPDEESVNVLYPPVEWDSLGPALDANAREDYWVTVGRLVPQKRVRRLIEAFRDTDERLVIAGTGPEREALDELAPANVEMLGYVDRERKRDLLRHARGFVFAGAGEGFGIAIAEALSAGTPVVAANEGNLPYLLNRSNGRLVDADPRSIRDGVRAANETTWDHATIREEARNYSAERFETRLRAIVDERGGNGGSADDPVPPGRRHPSTDGTER